MNFCKKKYIYFCTASMDLDNYKKCSHYGERNDNITGKTSCKYKVGRLCYNKDAHDRCRIMED